MQGSERRSHKAKTQKQTMALLGFPFLRPTPSKRKNSEQLLSLNVFDS